jgi:phosphatidylglycerophosphate synthase
MARRTIRDRFYPVLEPLARPLARVRPNTISAIALVTGLAAGGCYGAARLSPWLYLAGAVLVAVSGLADCFDGIVARQSGRETVLGDFLDHLFDRLVTMSIFVGLAFSPGATPALGLVTALLVLLNSYLGTQIQASFGSRDYTGLGRAQLFVALVAGSIALFVVPGAGWTIADLDVSLVNALFVVIAVATVQAMAHRVRLAIRLSSAADDEPGSGPAL